MGSVPGAAVPSPPVEVEVIDDPAAAVVALDPVRSCLLAELAEPASAAQLGQRLDLPRQKVRYHLHALEQHGLVHQVDERRHGGITERLLQASAGSYVVSPGALGDAAGPPATPPDRLSARYLVALGARLVHEVGTLVRGADRAGKPLATLGLDAEVRFASAADRAAFADELAAAATDLVSRYHDEAAPDGRDHRLVVAVHPIPRARPAAPRRDATPTATETQEQR